MRYRFGELELDVTSYTLSRAGQNVHVTPKVFDLLRHLVEQRGRVVTKDELLDTLWPDSRVNEGAIPWAINQARSALGQSGRDKLPIETVYGRGYRFVAEVEVLEPRASERPPALTVRAHAQWLVPPFVGRAHAMAQLQARLASAKSGHGGICTLIGTAGIGKTRCMEELSLLARAEGFDVWSGRSTEDAVAPVFWPWLQVLNELARDRSALHASVQTLLASLEGGPPGEVASEPLDGTPAGSFAFFAGVSGLLRDAAREAPVLLLLDDLHWADVGSVNLLSFVAQELSQQAVLVVTAQRQGRRAQTRELRRLWRHAERIELEPLEASDIGEYLATLAGTGERHAEVCEALQRATAGNPLYLLQAVRALLSEHGQHALGALVPERIKPVKSAADILHASLDALDEPSRRVLEIASVLGEELEVSTLEAVSGLPAPALLAALEAALREGFVLADAPNRYRFRHALLRSAIYDELGVAERARTHRRAAEVLERAATGPWRLGEIAHHYHRSLLLGDSARVVASAVQAAQAAARVQAYADAAIFYRWALDAQGVDRDARPRSRAELLLRCAQMEGLAGHAEEARRTIELLDEVARRHGYRDLLVRAARVLRPTHLLGAQADDRVCSMLEEVLRSAPDDERRSRISALSRLSWIPPYALDMERSKELSARALSLARELDDPGALFEALHARLYALSGPDDIAALLAVAGEMLRLDRTPPTWVSMEALVASAGAHVQRGDLAAADAAQATLGRIAHENTWPEPSWAHARILAQRRLLNGDFAGAEAALLELKTQARRLGLGYGSRLIDSMLGSLIAKREGPAALARSVDTSAFSRTIHEVMPSMRPSVAVLCLGCGQPAPAKSVLESMVGDAGAALPKERGYLSAVAHLALLAIELGDPPRAARLYELLAPYPHHNTPNTVQAYEGSVSHFLALLAVFLKRPERASSHFDDALAMNERLGMRPQLALTCYEHARFALGAHSPARAGAGRDLQQRAIALAEGLGMGWLAARARALG